MLTNELTIGECAQRNDGGTVMAERTETKRELTINMDRQRLHSAIAGAMRRKRIPRSFR